MKIFIFEDKKDEVEKAVQAVELAGHTAVVVEAVVRLGMNDEELVRTATLPVMSEGLTERGRRMWALNEGAPTTSAKERMTAREEVMKALREAVARSAEEDVGIITDLNFRLTADSSPSGLLVVIHAVAHGVPVCVCTDCGAEGHHGPMTSFIFDGYMVPMQEERVFQLVADKDWSQAVAKIVS